MKISVIGAGVMGARVTEVLIKGGHDVVMVDTTATCNRKPKPHRCRSGNRCRKGQADQGRERRALARITISNMCSDAAGSALVLECINEHLE